MWFSSLIPFPSLGVWVRFPPPAPTFAHLPLAALSVSFGWPANDMAKVVGRSCAAARVAAEAIFLEAPHATALARGLEVPQELAAEAVVADGRDTALDARRVLRMTAARRVDMEAAGLRVLEEGGRDARRERVGADDGGLGVLRVRT